MHTCEWIGKICSRAFRGLYNVRQIRKFLTVQSTKTLIHAFVSTHLDYYNALLFYLPKYQLDRLPKVHNAAARVTLVIINSPVNTMLPYKFQKWNRDLMNFLKVQKKTSQEKQKTWLTRTTHREEQFQPIWPSTILTPCHPGNGRRQLCYSSLTWFLSMLQQFVTLPKQSAGTHLYSWVKRRTVTVEWTAQEHNIIIQDRTEPWLPNLDSSGQSTRLPCSTRLSLILQFAIIMVNLTSCEAILIFIVTQIIRVGDGTVTCTVPWKNWQPLFITKSS